MRVEDHYRDMSEFETLLEDAKMAAATDREEAFVQQAQSKYDQYGGRMFWSDAQDNWLRRIAGPEDY